MKRLFCVLAIIASVMITAISCRSVKESSSVMQHKTSSKVDSFAANVSTGVHDSVLHYRTIVDSLTSELYASKRLFHELCTKDSIIVNQYRIDSISVRDSSWSVTNTDGSITHYKNTEKERFSYQQLEKYRQSIIRERQQTIDSLINENERIRNINDSLLCIAMEYDSVASWSHHEDVQYDSTATTVIKEAKDLWQKTKDNVWTMVIGIIIILAANAIALFYKKKE